MRIRFLGTSAALPSAERAHVSFVVFAERPLLVECGPTTHWQLERYAIDHRQIADVFISHIHGDHTLGLPMFLMAGELDGRDWPVRVYCPDSAIARLKAIVTACYPSMESLMQSRVEWIAASETAASSWSLGSDLTVAAAPGIHGVPEVAFRFESGGRALVYSGDTAPAPAVRELARGADLLLHEATWSETVDGMTSPDHTSARQAGQLAAEAGAGRLELVHLHRRYVGLETALQAEAAAAFAGEVLVPMDGDQLEV